MQWLNINTNDKKQQITSFTTVGVAIFAILFGYFFLSSGSHHTTRRPQTPYPQQDLVDLHDDLFLAHDEKLQSHLDSIGSTQFSFQEKDVQSAILLVGENSGKYDEVESKIREFSLKISEQEKLKSNLRTILQSSEKHKQFISGQKLIQNNLVEALKKAPEELQELRQGLDQVKKSQENVLERMENRIEEEKTKRQKTSELREEMKSATQNVQAMERKLRTHLRLLKNTEKSLDQIKKTRAEHARKASTNGAEIKQLEMKKISTESEEDTLRNEKEALEAERWTNNEQKQLRVSALELLESLSLGEDLASTKASREKRLKELESDLSDLKAKGPTNLKVESSNGDSESLKKVGYFAQLAHNKKLTELENNIAVVRSEIQFIDDFGTEDPKFVRESLTQEVQSFDVKLARLNAREGQLEARIEDVQSRSVKVIAELKQKREFRDGANTQNAHLAVTVDQLESELRGHLDNSKLIESSIEKARKAEKLAKKNLDDHLSVKLEDNTASLNQEKLKLDDEHIAIHKKIVALLGEHEEILAKSRAIDVQIQKAKRTYDQDLEEIRNLNAKHDSISLDIKRLYGELQALFQ